MQGCICVQFLVPEQGCHAGSRSAPLQIFSYCAPQFEFDTDVNKLPLLRCTTQRRHGPRKTVDVSQPPLLRPANHCTTNDSAPSACAAWLCEGNTASVCVKNALYLCMHCCCGENARLRFEIRIR